jgi:hypothetical protein
VIVGYATGEAKELSLRPTFDRRIKLEFHGGRITSDGGLLAYRELDDALGLTEIATTHLLDSRSGKNARHTLAGLFGSRYSGGSPATRMSTTPSGSPATPRCGDRRP